MLKRISILPIAVIAIMSFCTAKSSAEDSDFEEVSMHESFKLWDSNDDWLTDLTSKDYIFGGYWKSHIMLYSDYLKVGTPTATEHVAELYSTMPIPSMIGCLRLNVSYAASDLAEYVRGVDLVVADNADFSNPIATIHHDTSSDTYPHLWYFNIPTPSTNLYYKFMIDCKSVQDYEGSTSQITERVKRGGWLSIERIGKSIKQSAGVDNLTEEVTAGVTTYYTLSGIPVAEPESGIYIQVKAGRATKVIK